MNKKILFAGFVTSIIVAGPFAASALSIDELQAQIKELLNKISSLQVQANGQTSVSSSVVVEPSSTSPAMPRICGILNRNLVRGAQGDDVRSLQEFLASEGYLSASATGYFGPATANAVARWQSSQGVQSVGSVGPMTRDRIKMRCGNQYGFRVTPQAGVAPLSVTAYANVGGFTINRYAVDFGDGSAREPIACSAPADVCTTPGSVTHTYTNDGSYTVSLWQTNSSDNSSNVIAKESVRVGSNQNNGQFSAYPQSGSAPLFVSFSYRGAEENAQYYIEFGDGAAQVMDTQQIYCIRAPCINPAVAWHTYTTSGTYTATVSRYIACLYTNPRCMIAQPAPLASLKIVVGGSESGTPVISGFSGPVSLAVNEQGTWSISASDPENGRLTYAITWGDEWAVGDNSARATAPQMSIVQQTTFTHSYSQPGTYTIGLTVSDDSGKSARTSSTVQVSQTACTGEYAPVCGRPTGCANTCPPGMYCATMCRLQDPVTYSNRCQLNNANATFLHAGTCSGNESY